VRLVSKQTIKFPLIEIFFLTFHAETGIIKNEGRNILMLILSVQQAAKKLGCEPRTVRLAIAQGRLTAQKVGRDWIVMEDEKFFAFKPGRPGRPKGISKALKLARELAPVMREGTLKVVDVAEEISAVREERAESLRGA
jgi:excisionase family DNA binding protein